MRQNRFDEAVEAHKAVAAAEEQVTERVAERSRVVQRMLDSGVSAQDTADALGVHRSRVYSMAKSNYTDRRRNPSR